MIKKYQRITTYIALRYRKFLKGKILDVGCRDKNIKKYLGENIEYIGIDIAGTPDIFVDLEKQKIPFPENSFDCVVCIDVLEHLENLHEVFDDLIRVSKKYIIISLPNCCSCNFLKIITGKGNTKHYGLPVENPKNRHKWFFNYDEAKNFVIKRAEKNRAKIVDIHALIRKKPLRNFILRLIYGKRYKNIAALWFLALIKK